MSVVTERGNDEADPRKEFSEVMVDLGDHASRLDRHGPHSLGYEQSECAFAASPFAV